MKLSPAEQKILKRMAAGVLCREGFVGADTRPLQEILDTDRSTVERLGCTHEQLADRLRRVCEAAMAGLGTPVLVEDGRLTAEYREAMGYIPCPWADAARRPKGEVEITDPRTGRSLVCTPLSVHLIEAHGFYQGRGSRYRLEPADVAALFQLDEQQE
jgi:hypothetical protein